MHIQRNITVKTFHSSVTSVQVQYEIDVRKIRELYTGVKYIIAAGQ